MTNTAIQESRLYTESTFQELASNAGLEVEFKPCEVTYIGFNENNCPQGGYMLPEHAYYWIQGYLAAKAFAKRKSLNSIT